MVVRRQVGPSSLTVVRFTAPEARRSRTKGESPGGAGDLHAVVGLVVGEGEDVAAVDEEGGVAGAQVKVSGVELGEVGDEECGGAALAGGEALHSREELVVGEATKRLEELLRRLLVGHLGPPAPRESVCL